MNCKISPIVPKIVCHPEVLGPERHNLTEVWPKIDTLTFNLQDSPFLYWCSMELSPNISIDPFIGIKIGPA